MTVKEVKQALGSFQINLYPTIPKDILARVRYLGHIAILEGRINPAEYGDEILDAARYVGVYRNRVNDVDNRTSNVVGSYNLHGVGLAYWLGDEDGKGHVLESLVNISNQSFANSIRALLPDTVTEGTLHTIAGTHSSKHQWKTPRAAINYVTTSFDAEWRVNNDGSFDAGLVSQLYPANPRAMLVKNEYGRDLLINAYQGKIDSAEDIEDFSTRIVLLAEGEGATIATGSADISGGDNPYKDLLGNTVNLTRIISESGTLSGSAASRASMYLQDYSGTRRSMRLATSEYSVSGTLRLGEWIYVYDPDTGLLDTNNEVYFRGNRINPAKYRMSEIEWPVTPGMTVAYRDWDGNWIDLTEWVNFEAGDVHITIGELPRSLAGGGSGEPVGTRPSDDFSIPDNPTWDTPFFTSAYLDGMGNTRAQILLTWNTPLNTDGSTILDGLHYEINYGIHPASEWQTVFAAWGNNETLISDLAPGVEYDIRIRAVDRYAHNSDWSPTEAVTVAPDSIAPSTPAAATVAGSLIAIQVSHNLGKNSGGTFNLESDLDHLEIHLGTSSGFTPSNSTLIGKLPANYGMIQGATPAVGTFPTEETALRYVKVIAVDQAGNGSTPSPAASVTADLIDDAHISNLTVSKVTAGTISANWLIGAEIRTAASGQRVVIDSTGIKGYNSGGINTVNIASTGAFTIQTSTTGARISIDNVNGIRAFNSGGAQTVSITPAGVFTLQTASSGARVVLDAAGIRSYNSGGTETVNIESSTGTATLTGEVRSAASGRRIVVNPHGATNPEIKFYPASGVNETSISSPPSFPGDTAELLAVTGYGLNSRRGSLFLGSGFCYLKNGDGGSAANSNVWLYQDGKAELSGASILINAATTDVNITSANDMVLQGDEVVLQSNGISFRGRVTPANVDSAIVCGKANTSGTSGTVFYGPTYSSGVPYPAAQVRAGNSGAFNITNGAPSNFTWIWSGPSLNATFDHINWFGRIE